MVAERPSEKYESFLLFENVLTNETQEAIKDEYKKLY